MKLAISGGLVLHKINRKTKFMPPIGITWIVIVEVGLPTTTMLIVWFVRVVGKIRAERWFDGLGSSLV